MDESAHERMERYEELAEKEREYRERKRELLADVGDDLTAAVETAIDGAGANVAVRSTSNDGTTQTLTARLDRAALVASVTEELPAGFVVEHVNEDGSLTVTWDRHDYDSEERRCGAILKAVVAEETVTDDDGLVLSAPTVETVIERTTALGVAEGTATRRLDRLADLDVVDVEDGHVYTDTNFSRF